MSRINIADSKFVTRVEGAVRPVVKVINGVKFIKKVDFLFDNDVKMRLSTVLEKKSSVLRKESYHMLKVDITCNKKSGSINAITSMSRQGENRFLDHVELFEKVVTTSSSTRKYSEKDAYTEDMIIVGVDGVLNEKIIDGPLFINSSKNKVFIETTTEGRDKNGNIRRMYKELVNNHYTFTVGNAKEYKMMNHSSGSLKKGESYWYCTKIADSPLEIINSVVPGVVELAKKKMTQAQAVKFATRPALAWSQNTVLSLIDSVGVFDGIFDKSQFINELGQLENNNTLDGQGFIRASYVMALFNLKTVEEAIGIILQSRLYGVYKYQLIVINDDLYDEIEKECLSRGKIKVYGTTGNKTVMLLDSNCEKAKIDPREIMLSLMAIGKVTEGTTSKQLIEKVIIAAAREGKLDEALKMLRDAGFDYICDQVAKLLETDPKGISLTDSYILDILKKSCPQNPVVVGRAFKDMMRAFRLVADKLKLPLYTMYNGIKTSTIYNAVVSGDLTAIFGNGLIPKNFIVFGKFSKKFAKIHREFGKDSKEYKELERKFKRFVAIKYPSMYTREFASGEIMDIVDLEEIINSSELSDVRKQALITYFNNMADATAMFPALREVFETLAGMDTDFDKIQIVFNAYIVGLLYGKQMTLKISPFRDEEVQCSMSELEKNLIQKGINIEKSFTLDDRFFRELYKLQSQYEGMIGIITFYNNRVNSIMASALTGNLKAAEHFLAESVKSTLGQKGKYKVNRKVINPNYVDEMIEQMQTLEWSAKNIIAFLDDCSKVFRLYQETAIDGGKTGVYLAIRLSVKSVITASLLKIDLVEEENGKCYLAREEYVQSTVKLDDETEVKTAYLVDPMGELQDMLMEIINGQVRDVFEKNKDKFRYTEKEIEKFSDAVEKVSTSSKTGKSIIEQLYTLKAIYNDRTSAYIEGMSKVKPNNDDYEEVMEDLKDCYRYETSVISNSCRRLLEKIKYVNDPSKDAAFRGNVMLGVSILNPKTKKASETSKNRFAYNLVPDLTYTALLGGTSYTATSKVLQTGNAIPGEVEFVNGFNKNGLVIADNYTGKAFFDVYRNDDDGKIYRTVTAQMEIEFEELNADEFILVIRKAIADKLCGSSNGLMKLIGDNSAVTVTADGVFVSKDANSEYVNVGLTELFDGKKNEEYGFESIYCSEILLNDNIREKGKKAFWSKEQVYVIRLSR